MSKTEKNDRQKIRKRPARKKDSIRAKQPKKSEKLHALKFASPKNYPTQQKQQPQKMTATQKQHHPQK